eukprot:tig00000769_g4015.t1
MPLALASTRGAPCSGAPARPRDPRAPGLARPRPQSLDAGRLSPRRDRILARDACVAELARAAAARNALDDLPSALPAPLDRLIHFAFRPAAAAAPSVCWHADGQATAAPPPAAAAARPGPPPGQIQLACIVAALCHDLRHPGTTNAFQRESQSFVFLAYGAVSTLEKMHAVPAERAAAGLLRALVEYCHRLARPAGGGAGAREEGAPSASGALAEEALEGRRGELSAAPDDELIELMFGVPCADAAADAACRASNSLAEAGMLAGALAAALAPGPRDPAGAHLAPCRRWRRAPLPPASPARTPFSTPTPPPPPPPPPSPAGSRSRPPWTALVMAHRLPSLFERLSALFRMAICGGGALAAFLDDFYEVVGVPILIGYGLTETAPTLTARREVANVAHSAGLPVPGTQVRVVDPETLAPVEAGATGLVVARGPQVMAGYYKDPEATAKVLDADGWFNTGDRGWVTPGGHLVITGRYKDIIVLSNGENIEPAAVEDVLIRSELIDQVVLVGQDQKSLGALVVPNLDALRRWARGRGRGELERARAGGRQGRRPVPRPNPGVSPEQVDRLFETEIAKLVRTKASFRPDEKIGAFRLVPEPFTMENGLMTQTLKIKRNEVYDRYEALIREMYE